MKALFGFLRSVSPRSAPWHGTPAQDAEVIGLCRFSYPALGGFQKQHDSPEARARYLYDPARLDERFRLFEAVTLAGIRGQTDPDFLFLVVIGQDFPQRDRLERLLADIPQARILAYPPRQHRPVMQEAINSQRNPDAPLSLQFRLDDDDGVNLRFVERLREVSQQARPLIRSKPMTAIDFNHGHVFRASSRGIEAERVTRAYWAPGLAVAVRRGNPRTVMNFGHHLLWQHMPTLTLTDRDMFLRGMNPFNDSEFKAGETFGLLDAEGEAAFRAAYGVDAGRVRALWRES